MKSAGLSCAGSSCINWIFLLFFLNSFDTSTCVITARRLPTAYCILTSSFFFVSLFVASFFCLSVCLQLLRLSVLFMCRLIFLALFVSRPVGCFLTGVALVEPSSGIKRQRERQALSHYAGPLLLALIESSDPKLMRRGARAHLMSAADVLHGQTGERQ